jgi:hypothetical protein
MGSLSGRSNLTLQRTGARVARVRPLRAAFGASSSVGEDVC